MIRRFSPAAIVEDPEAEDLGALREALGALRFRGPDVEVMSDESGEGFRTRSEMAAALRALRAQRR
jgi:hypothetical protein